MRDNISAGNFQQSEKNDIEDSKKILITKKFDCKSLSTTLLNLFIYSLLYTNQ